MLFLYSKVCKVNKKCWGNPVNHIIGKISGDTVKQDEKIHSELEKNLGCEKPHEYTMALKH